MVGFAFRQPWHRVLRLRKETANGHGNGKRSRVDGFPVFCFQCTAHRADWCFTAGIAVSVQILMELLIFIIYSLRGTMLATIGKFHCIFQALRQCAAGCRAPVDFFRLHHDDV